MRPEDRQRLARVGAPAAFLLAFTIFVLIVRSGGDEEPASTVPATTLSATTTAAPATTAQPAATTAPQAETDTAAETEGETYVIQSGDTLETVAAQHDTSVDALVDLNPGIDPRALTIGQEIRVR